eukprot:1143057-Pelagomonas_calceolata.AAC.4
MLELELCLAVLASLGVLCWALEQALGFASRVRIALLLQDIGVGAFCSVALVSLEALCWAMGHSIGPYCWVLSIFEHEISVFPMFCVEP